MPSAHCVSTIDGVILAADRGFFDLLGRPEEAIIGASYRAITHPDDLDKSAEMLRHLVEGGPPVRLQKRYIRPDGSVVPANIFVTRFADPERLVSTLFWTGAGRDLPPARLWDAALRLRYMSLVRRHEFGTDLGLDPAGSLLLELYLAEAEGRVSASSRLAAEVQLSRDVTRRWLSVLRQRGIVETSGRAGHVQLTQAGIEKAERTLAAAFTIPPS